MAWLILILAGLFEIGWALGLKVSEGFTRPVPTTWTIIAMIVSFALLGVAMKTIPASTAYGVWVGIGTVGTVILGAIFLDEPASVPRFVFTALIIVGVVGLKLTTTS